MLQGSILFWEYLAACRGVAMADTMAEILAYERGFAVGLRGNGNDQWADHIDAMLDRMEDKGALNFRCAPTRDDVLTIEQVAERLQISKRHVERMHPPCFYLGTRTRRYIWGAILDFCARKMM